MLEILYRRLIQQLEFGDSATNTLRVLFISRKMDDMNFMINMIMR